MTWEQAVRRAAEEHDSFYIYDESRIIEDVARLKRSFPQVEFLYSVKCNPQEKVLRTVLAQGFGADAASLGEVLLAREAGLAPEKIYFSAPGKTEADIEGALGSSVLIADSLEELRRIDAAAERRGETVCVGVRLNPDFAFNGGPSTPSKFGIDEDQFKAFWAEGGCARLRVTGIHVHLKSQELDAQALARYYENMFALAGRMEEVCGGRLDYVNLGSGMGVPYGEDQTPLDIEGLGALFAAAYGAFHAVHPGTRVLIEVGRYAVCKSGVYITKVLDRKVSRGKTFILLKNTLNGFVRPSIIQMVGRYAPGEAAAWEPLFTRKGAFEIRPLKEDGARETVTLAGNLCTATDVIAEDVTLPRLDCGDLVRISNAGAYAAVLSPMQFASQERPAELFFTKDGTLA